MFRRESPQVRVVLVMWSVSILITLAACSSSSSPGDQNPDAGATIVATSTLTIAPLITSTVGLAPPYEEIYATMRQRARYDINQGGPEVGDDGIVDPAIRKAVNDYEASLRGRRVEGWIGWVRNVSQQEIDHGQIAYNLNVHMTDPIAVPEISRTALLRRLSREQVEAIQPSVDLEQPFASWHDPLPNIVFSGTIWNVFYDGQIEIGDVTIQQVVTK